MKSWKIAFWSRNSNTLHKYHPRTVGPHCNNFEKKKKIFYARLPAFPLKKCNRRLSIPYRCPAYLIETNLFASYGIPGLIDSTVSIVNNHRFGYISVFVHYPGLFAINLCAALTHSMLVWHGNSVQFMMLALHSHSQMWTLRHNIDTNSIYAYGFLCTVSSGILRACVWVLVHSASPFTQLP